MQYEICTYGNPALREKAEPIEAVTDEIKQLVSDMLETMHAEDGLGLAAEQIGKALALCVIEIPEESDMDDDGVRLNPDLPMPWVLLNPEIITASDDTFSREEGCLSFPGIYAPVTRSWEVTVRFMNLDGETQELTVSSLAARAVQHELDHLNAVLFVDRVMPVKKITLSSKLKRLSRRTKRLL